MRLGHDRGNLVDAHALGSGSGLASDWSVRAELAFAYIPVNCARAVFARPEDPVPSERRAQSLARA